MKITRAEVLRELVEEGYSSAREEWRNTKKERRLKPVREGKTPKEQKDQRRIWKLQRSIRRGEYDVTGEKKTKDEDVEERDSDSRRNSFWD